MIHMTHIKSLWRRS